MTPNKELRINQSYDFELTVLSNLVQYGSSSSHAINDPAPKPTIRSIMLAEPGRQQVNNPPVLPKFSFVLFFKLITKFLVGPFVIFQLLQGV